MDNAFKYAKANKIETEADYPYVGKGQTCAYQAAKGKVVLSGLTDVTANSPSQL